MWWGRKAASWLAQEAWGIGIKEILKWIVLAIVAVASTSILTAISNVLQVPGGSWTAVWDKTLEALRAPYQYVVQSLLNDPVYYFTVLALVSFNLILAVLLRRAYTHLRISTAKQVLAEEAGLGGRWPHAKLAEPDGAPWDKLREEILRADNHHLDILGANGVDTFGGTGSPLFETLREYRGNLRVILIDPDSRELEGRAGAVATDPREYKANIRTSERRLKELRKQHHAIEGRFYTGQPNWKLIITDKTAWIQYYAPGGHHVDETPVWRFDSTQNGDGLFHLFRMEFERIFRRCEGNDMNLR